MKISRISALLLAAALSLSAAAGCSDENDTSSASVILEKPQTATYAVSPDGKLEGMAENVQEASFAQQTKMNDTLFTLNKVVDSGKRSDAGEKYIYLDVTIENPTDKAYALNMLNNFYVLFDDGSETHYDVRTQLYAVKNLTGYTASPFDVPAQGSFTGLIGGFIIPAETNSFTVCFFPSLDNDKDKSNVIKVPVTSDNITQLDAQ